MKKMALSILAAILTAGLISCGRGQDKTEGEERISENREENGQEMTELVLWTFPVGNWGNSTNVASLLSRFHRKYPNIHVSVEFLDYQTGDRRVDEGIASGQLPDLVLEGPERLVVNWGKQGVMEDLSDLWNTDSAGRIYESVHEACESKNGEYYIFPLCMGPHCMAINYDMFKEAGALQYIDEENHTWSTEDFIHAVEALTAYGQEKAGVVYCGGQGGDQGTRALVNNLYSGTFTDSEHSRYTADSEENLQALRLLRDLEGISFEPDMVGGDEIVQFAGGELAMAFCWNVSIEIQQIVTNPDLTFEVFPMVFPTDNGEPQLQGGIWGFGIFDNGDEEKIKAAKTFIRYMTGDDAQYTKAVQVSSYWPVREMEHIYANDVLMDEYSIFTQYMGDYYQITPGWTEARTAWWQMLQKIGGGEEIEAAVDEFVEKANAAAGLNP